MPRSGARAVLAGMVLELGVQVKTVTLDPTSPRQEHCLEGSATLNPTGSSDASGGADGAQEPLQTWGPTGPPPTGHGKYDHVNLTHGASTEVKTSTDIREVTREATEQEDANYEHPAKDRSAERRTGVHKPVRKAESIKENGARGDDRRPARALRTAARHGEGRPPDSERARGPGSLLRPHPRGRAPEDGG